ncbi:MAG: hypothetical protein WC794_02925 [Candidatus Doudnabacteria bacterium]
MLYTLVCESGIWTGYRIGGGKPAQTLGGRSDPEEVKRLCEADSPGRIVWVGQNDGYVGIPVDPSHTVMAHIA